MVQVVWQPSALAQVRRITAYTARFSPSAAESISDKLMQAGESLAHHPDRGRSIGRGRRELVVVPPYIIRYRVRRETVDILLVRHGARRPLP